MGEEEKRKETPPEERETRRNVQQQVGTPAWVKEGLFNIWKGRDAAAPSARDRAATKRPLVVAKSPKPPACASGADPRWPTVLALAEMFRTTDNDYIFACLYGANLTPDELNRWLVAYSWFLHAGVAAYLTAFDGDAFYDAVGAEFDSFPREKERRHFRGERARNAVAQHQQDWPHPGDAVTRWFEGRTWESFCERAGKVKMLGPMMRFQVYDTAQCLFRAATGASLLKFSASLLPNSRYRSTTY